MLAFAALVGGVVVADAHRIQPEAARLAPQLDAAAMGVQQVPAITLDAIRGVRSEDKTPDPWGIRDPPKVFASRGLVSDSVADLYGQTEQGQAELDGQAEAAQGFSTMAVADVESLLDEEIKELRQKLTEATALKTKFYTVEANLKALKGKIAEVDSVKQQLEDVTEDILKANPDELDEKQLDMMDAKLAVLREAAELEAKARGAGVEVEKKVEKTVEEARYSTKDTLEFFKEDLEKAEAKLEDQLRARLPGQPIRPIKPNDPKKSKFDMLEEVEEANRKAMDGFSGI